MFFGAALGMLAGWAVDLDRLGVYALLELCRGAPGFSLDAIKVELMAMPGTWAGMFLGAHAGALAFHGLLRLRRPATGRLIHDYLACHLGMILGMQGGKALALAVATMPDLGLASTLLIASMLSGMGAGMAVAALGMQCLQRFWPKRIR